MLCYDRLACCHRRYTIPPRPPRPAPPRPASCCHRGLHTAIRHPRINNSCHLLPPTARLYGCMHLACRSVGPWLYRQATRYSAKRVTKAGKSTIGCPHVAYGTATDKRVVRRREVTDIAPASCTAFCSSPRATVHSQRDCTTTSAWVDAFVADCTTTSMGPHSCQRLHNYQHGSILQVSDSTATISVA